MTEWLSLAPYHYPINEHSCHALACVLKIHDITSVLSKLAGLKMVFREAYPFLTPLG